MNEEEFQRSMNLQEARDSHSKTLKDLKEKYKDTQKLAKEAKTLAKSVTPWGVFSLLSHINPLIDWIYAFAIFFAILKDILDFAGIGSLPVIGTVITFCVSITIGFAILLANTLEKDRTIFQKTIIRYAIIIVGTLAELLFGLNFVPWETAVALAVYAFALAARKNRETVGNESNEES
ncbi:MAG: hypothetical protein V1804_02600 [Patescibacteria group bacterium]